MLPSSIVARGKETQGRQDPRRFPTTRWSLVVAAGGTATPASRRALSDLYEAYWYPVYAFIRGAGRPAEEAHDLTQGFFTRLLEKNDIAGADQERGKFRSFLLAAARHYVANEWDRSRALKRGGGAPLLSIDAVDAEGRFLVEPAHLLTPERLFERRWALTVLDRTLRALRDDCERRGKVLLFDRLKDFLPGGDDGVQQTTLARELGMELGALRTAISRLRERYRQLLREQIAQTVDDEADVPGEIQELLAALRTS